MNTPKIIDLAKEFTNRPFGRYRDDGERSAEIFRDDILRPALDEYDKVIVDLGGTNYYGSSFLEEVFGGLIRAGFKKEALLRKLEIRHEKLPSVVTESYDYMDAAASEAH